LQQLLRPQDQVKPYLVSILPDRASPATQRILASFGDDSPVSFRHCAYRAESTEPAGCYIIRSQQSGSRTIVTHNELAEITASEFDRVVSSFGQDEQTWWHFEVAEFPLSPRRG
jgi:ketohexokinase